MLHSVTAVTSPPMRNKPNYSLKNIRMAINIVKMVSKEVVLSSSFLAISFWLLQVLMLLNLDKQLALALPILHAPMAHSQELAGKQAIA